LNRLHFAILLKYARTQLHVGSIYFNSALMTISVVCPAGGDELCQLQNYDDDALAAEPERGTSLQRLWTLLQAAQCEF
jgi:hypothetical protein